MEFWRRRQAPPQESSFFDFGKDAYRWTRSSITSGPLRICGVRSTTLSGCGGLRVTMGQQAGRLELCRIGGDTLIMNLSVAKKIMCLSNESQIHLRPQGNHRALNECRSVAFENLQSHMNG
jgi:hypothetical protein